MDKIGCMTLDSPRVMKLGAKRIMLYAGDGPVFNNIRDAVDMIGSALSAGAGGVVMPEARLGMLWFVADLSELELKLARRGCAS